MLFGAQKSLRGVLITKGSVHSRRTLEQYLERPLRFFCGVGTALFSVSSFRKYRILFERDQNLEIYY